MADEKAKHEYGPWARWFATFYNAFREKGAAAVEEEDLNPYLTDKERKEIKRARAEAANDRRDKETITDTELFLKVLKARYIGGD